MVKILGYGSSSTVPMLFQTMIFSLEQESGSVVLQIVKVKLQDFISFCLRVGLHIHFQEQQIMMTKFGFTTKMVHILEKIMMEQ